MPVTTRQTINYYIDQDLPELASYRNDLLAYVANMTQQGLTDGIRTMEPNDDPTFNRTIVRSWINRAAADQWMSYMDSKIVENNLQEHAQGWQVIES